MKNMFMSMLCIINMYSKKFNHCLFSNVSCPNCDIKICICKVSVECVILVGFVIVGRKSILISVNFYVIKSLIGSNYNIEFIVLI